MPSIVIPANTMEGIVDVIRELAALNDTELLQVLNETLNSTVNIALAAAKGQDYIIQSKEEAARQKARDAFEHKKECASKEWSKYISTEDYSMRTELQSMENKARKELEVLAYLIGRAIRGESITDNKTKDFQEFLDEV